MRTARGFPGGGGALSVVDDVRHRAAQRPFLVPCVVGESHFNLDLAARIGVPDRVGALVCADIGTVRAAYAHPLVFEHGRFSIIVGDVCRRGSQDLPDLGCTRDGWYARCGVVGGRQGNLDGAHWNPVRDDIACSRAPLVDEWIIVVDSVFELACLVAEVNLQRFEHVGIGPSAYPEVQVLVKVGIKLVYGPRGLSRFRMTCRTVHLLRLQCIRPRIPVPC